MCIDFYSVLADLVELPVTAVWTNERADVDHCDRIIGYRGKRRQILVIDDRWENRAVIKSLLAPLGFDLLEADHGQDGLDKLQINQPDLVITDLIMPVMDGYEFLRHVRASETLKQTIVIASSASVAQQSRHMASKSGSNDFLAKPVDASALLFILANYLQLTWIYSDVETTAAANLDQLSAQVVIPPRQVLEILLKSAQEADINTLRAQLTELTEVDPVYGSFVEPIMQLSRRFEAEEIETLLNRYLIEGASNV